MENKEWSNKEVKKLAKTIKAKDVKEALDYSIKEKQAPKRIGFFSSLWKVLVARDETQKAKRKAAANRKKKTEENKKRYRENKK